MSKKHRFSANFQKSKSPLIFDIGDLKLRDLAKLWFFKLIMTKSNLKICYDVISATSLLLRHRKTSPK